LSDYALKAIIHEILHKSGIHDEAEVVMLADRHFERFKHAYYSQFEGELKILLEE